MAIDHVAMVEPLPLQVVGNAKPLEHPPHRTALLPAGNVVHAGIEPEQQLGASRGIAATNPLPAMGKAARHDMLLAHHHLESAVGQ